ncbi:MAG TPA: hypothetical protein VF808_18590 [Ktedonobacterales bacterium]
MITRRLPATHSVGSPQARRATRTERAQRTQRTRRSRRGSRGPARLLVALFTLALIGAAALGRHQLAAVARSWADALPPVTFHPTELLYSPRTSGPAFDAALLLLAPLIVAVGSGLFSLGGTPWRRLMLASLSLLVTAFNLLSCLFYVWAFAWGGTGAGVIGAGAYLALSASAAYLVLAFGFFHLALARAWRWPALGPRHTRGVMRWWVFLAASGSALLIASYFMVWGHWRAADGASAEAAIPGATLTDGPPLLRAYALAALVALPLLAALCAFIYARAPRWSRAPLALLGLLAGGSSLAVCLITLARLYLRANGSSVLERGAFVGLGASALLLTALFGLLSTPAPRAAPATVRLPAASAAPATARLPAVSAAPRRARDSQPLLPAPVLARPRALTTRRLTDTSPVSAP